jgi:hypothetical protein
MPFAILVQFSQHAMFESACERIPREYAWEVVVRLGAILQEIA